jgi:hypothetical protein
MISFTTIPYAEALRRARLQDWVVRLLAGAVFALLIVLLLWRFV